MKKQYPMLVTLLTALLLSNSAQANKSEDKEAKELTLFNQASISIHDAINAAEQKVGGKAMEAEINDESATVQFEVEVIKNGKIHNVIIDGKTGDVVKVAEEKEGKEADEGAENEKE